jgi:hypothetical protein
MMCESAASSGAAAALSSDGSTAVAQPGDRRVHPSTAVSIRFVLRVLQGVDVPGVRSGSTVARSERSLTDTVASMWSLVVDTGEQFHLRLPERVGLTGRVLPVAGASSSDIRLQISVSGEVTTTSPNTDGREVVFSTTVTLAKGKVVSLGSFCRMDRRYSLDAFIQAGVPNPQGTSEP